jgi:transcriptional regulator with XRE-family HTH domain
MVLLHVVVDPEGPRPANEFNCSRHCLVVRSRSPSPYELGSMVTLLHLGSSPAISDRLPATMSTDGGQTLGFNPDELRRERVRVGWSQDELASRLGVSQPTVSTWENGTSEPRSQNLAALSRLLDIQGIGSTEGAPQAEAPTTSPLRRMAHPGTYSARHDPPRALRAVRRQRMTTNPKLTQPQIPPASAAA